MYRAKAMRKAIVLIAVPLCSRGPSKLLVALDCNRRAGVTCVTCPQIGRFGVNRSGRCKSALRPDRENPGYDGVAKIGLKAQSKLPRKGKNDVTWLVGPDLSRRCQASAPVHDSNICYSRKTRSSEHSRRHVGRRKADW